MTPVTKVDGLNVGPSDGTAAERNCRPAVAESTAAVAVRLAAECVGFVRPGRGQFRFLLPVAEARAGREVPPVFVPVEVVEGPRLSRSELPRVDGAPDQRSGDIEITLLEGVTIHLSEPVDELDLRTVLRAVLAETTSC